MFAQFRRYSSGIIAILSLFAIVLYLIFRFATTADETTTNLPLHIALLLGGGPLVIELSIKMIKREFGSDLLAGISIVTSVILGEYLAGTIVVLMLSGGEALEQYALRSASSVLRALAGRMPSITHRKENGTITDVAINDLRVGDTVVVYPHEVCPVDGVVLEGHGVMDESYLTGEPFRLQKTVGTTVISGAINGESALTIRATQRPEDSRYAKIMEVMRESEQTRPRLRRIGDQLGAWYTPIAVALALIAWAVSGEAIRFLAVLVVATPCPLLIAIPVAIIGSISLCARRAIIIKSPVVLEQISQCRTAIFDKTGTLTNGEPRLTELIPAKGFDRQQLLLFAATLERYSKHPLAQAVLAAAKEQKLQLLEAGSVSEPPGAGLRGTINARTVEITGRRKLEEREIAGKDQIPEQSDGLECMMLVDNAYAATLRFRDAARGESRSFVQHLGPKHAFARVIIISGDRESEVRYLAQEVGINEVYAQKTPEEKLAIVRKETAMAKTLYVGDGINDAPAMMAATAGVAIGGKSEVTAEAAGAVVMDNSLTKVDEFMHISRHMRAISLQSAVGGMALSIIGMIAAAFGLLVPVAGALFQEIIDVIAVLNALRAAIPPKVIQDHVER